MNHQKNNIQTKEDFQAFLEGLIIDFETKPENWENDKLVAFLKGLHGYCYDVDDMKPSWTVFSELLLAARVYE